MLFDEKLINSVKKFLVSRKESIAVAESVTSGFLQAALSTAEDASKFFQGGITVYNLGQKYRHLLIDPIHAESCHCVSERIARDMAVNVCNLFRSEWGISITGYAAPVFESNNRLFAYYAVSHKGKIMVDNKVEAQKNDPLHVQIFFAQQVLKDFGSYIKKSEGEKW